MRNPTHLRPALVLALVLAACGASAREKTISATMGTLDAASATFTTWDRQHQLDIVSAAPSKAVADQQLAGYRDTRGKVQLALASAYRAVAVAATLDSDQSVAAMVQAVAILSEELGALGVKVGGSK